MRALRSLAAAGAVDTVDAASVMRSWANLRTRFGAAETMNAAPRLHSGGCRGIIQPQGAKSSRAGLSPRGPKEVVRWANRATGEVGAGVPSIRRICRGHD